MGERPSDRGLDEGFVDLAVAVLARKIGGVVTGALAEDQQVGERVAAQAIGAVKAGGALAGGEQTRYRRHLALGVDPDAAHHVVGSGAHLHRLRGDVDSRQLLELVVHAR